MSDNEYEALTLDEVAEQSGGYFSYTIGSPLLIDADYRAMSRYCIERGITPMDLTEEEYSLFLYDEPLVYA